MGPPWRENRSLHFCARSPVHEGGLRFGLAVCAFLLALGSFAGRANACEMILLRQGLPGKELILGRGSVIGYGTFPRPIATIGAAPSLLVRVDAVVSGEIKLGETEVVPLFFGPDCQSTPTASQVLETSFPIGAAIAFSTAAAPRGDAPSTKSIVVESNQGGFVVSVPRDVVRTRHGDLDFAHFDAGRSWLFVEFEFARAVIELRRARGQEKFERLMNLAHYQGFRDKRGRAWLEELIAESRLTTRQRNAVLTASVDQLQPIR